MDSINSFVPDFFRLKYKLNPLNAKEFVND